MVPSSQNSHAHGSTACNVNHWSEFSSAKNEDGRTTISITPTATHQRKGISMSFISIISIILLITRCDAYTSLHISRGFIRRTKASQPSHSFIRHLDLSASATIDNSSSYEMSNFANRMKKLITKERRSKKHNATRNRAPKNLLRIETLEDFKQLLGNQQGKIVVVRWYAPWCKACKAIAPLFYRLASTFPDAIFVDVPVTPENTNLHQGLGVPSLPFGHIYHPTGKLVEELKISRKHFSRFARILKNYVNDQCDVEYDSDGVVYDPNDDAGGRRQNETSETS